LRPEIDLGQIIAGPEHQSRHTARVERIGRSDRVPSWWKSSEPVFPTVVRCRREFQQARRGVSVRIKSIGVDIKADDPLAARIDDATVDRCRAIERD
jgi:hypothetical protein